MEFRRKNNLTIEGSPSKELHQKMYTDVEMDLTTTKHIMTEPIGVTLRENRERLGLSRKEVAVKTNIPERYLDTLENGTANSGLDAYTKIYLKAYGKFLNLDADALIMRYAAETTRAERADSPLLSRRHPVVAIPARMLIATPRLIRIAGGIILVGIILAYFVGALQRLVAPPPVTVLTPLDGTITTDRSITVEGFTAQEVMLRVNGQTVSIDSEGRFHDSIALQEGVNVIKVVGARKHSKEATIERRVIVRPKERQAAQLNFIEITE